jgi:FAD/FMN-containing dehydrogenase
MHVHALTHPTATVARGIENLILFGENNKNPIYKASAFILSRLVSLIVFPIIVGLELVFKDIPKLAVSLYKGGVSRRLDKILKKLLTFVFFPLGLRSADALSLFYIKRLPEKAVRPFGVETQYGLKVNEIYTPQKVEELQELVLKAKKEKKQISVIGAGFSQGTQTVPVDDGQIVINCKNLHHIELASDLETVTVGAGATWEQLQLELDKCDRSVIVKQASDPFSIGGSISGINCHGWAHDVGSISKTIVEMTIIDAEGNLKVLRPEDEHFKCMIGTMGYFGILVSAKIHIVKNEPMVEIGEEIDIEDFHNYYETKIKSTQVPLFGGRLNLDFLNGDPLRTVCMDRFERDFEVPLDSAKVMKQIQKEPKTGTRMERIALNMVSNLFYSTTKRLLSNFWSQEKSAMLKGRKLTRNEALHPPINSFFMLHRSNLHAQWLQEYFLTKDELEPFLRFLGKTLKNNQVRLINATIRPTPKDELSILPYAEQDRFAVVISFAQKKTQKEIAKTEKWIKEVNAYLLDHQGVFYQAYMPFASREDFERSYGKERVERMRDLKEKYDPEYRFGNAHTKKYYNREE